MQMPSSPMNIQTGSNSSDCTLEDYFFQNPKTCREQTCSADGSQNNEFGDFQKLSNIKANQGQKERYRSKISKVPRSDSEGNISRAFVDSLLKDADQLPSGIKINFGHANRQAFLRCNSWSSDGGTNKERCRILSSFLEELFFSWDVDDKVYGNWKSSESGETTR